MTDPDPQTFELDSLGLRAPTELCNRSPQLVAPGMQPDRATPAGAPVATPATAAVTGGPGQDMLEALEAGYFEKIGHDPEFSSMAGTWADPS